jgi:sigma-E factor negative regulatory protein RseB
MLPRKFLLVLIAFASFSPAVGYAQQAGEWLARMADALDSLNYEGTFVYMAPGRAETFKVFHRVADGEITERILALDGAGAEIIRNADELICIFPSQKSVVVESRQGSENQGSENKGNLLKARIPNYSQTLSHLYDFKVIGNERTLDREVAVVLIEPRDALRFGYRIWLDKATAMPLKSQLIGADSDMPLEEIRFTSIRLPRRVSAAAVQTQIDTSDYTWKRQQQQQSGVAEVQPVDEWRSRDLPVGFELTMESIDYSDISASHRTHLVYSDGLATVSVFIDAAVAASEQAEGLSMMGAANAYSLVRDGLLVTAMGEVPPQTVEQIALSTVPVSSN